LYVRSVIPHALYVKEPGLVKPPGR
jgi:hypothetical protein